MTIEVREASPDEHPETGRVTSLAYREFVRPQDTDWQTYLDRIADVAERAQRTVILIATEDGHILGSATLELDERTEAEDGPLGPRDAHIRMLGVDPAARGRGVGSRLMAACEARALAAGKTRMTLHTTERMAAARAMYESQGYLRGPDRVFEDGFVLISYAKPLVDPAP
jgi:ribosomal protein S18 acetylase RimI-like enzyme